MISKHCPLCPLSPVSPLCPTGLVAAAMQSLARGQRRLDTPQLAIRYQAPRESVFWND